MKGLRLEIYTPSYGNCSNGGISSRCRGVTLVGPGIDGVFDANDDYPAVQIKSGYKGYMFVEPLDKKPNTIGPMAGGCLVWSSDSRVREVMPSPLALHDRFETQEEYDRYST